MKGAHERMPMLVDRSAVLFAMLFPSVLTWVYFVALAGQPSAMQQASYSVGKLIQFLLPLAWVFACRGQPFKWGRPSAKGIVPGIGFGVVVIVAMLLTFHELLKPNGYFEGPGEAVRRKIVSMGLGTTARYIALGVFYTLGHSFLEEYYWRWFVFAELRRHLSTTKAIWVSSAAFMAHHVIVLAVYFGWASPATWIFSLSVAVGGAVWAKLYDQTGSLMGPWISHLLVDAGIFIVGYDLLNGVL